MSLDSQHRAVHRPEPDSGPAGAREPGNSPSDAVHAESETAHLRLDPETAHLPRDRSATEPGQDAPEAEKDAPADRPSGVQVTASALAAVTATGVLSTLGVAGTIIGAALSSVVTVMANYLYSSSLRRTAAKVAAAPPMQKVRARTRTGTTATIALAAGAQDGSTVALGKTVVDGAAAPVAAADQEAGQGSATGDAEDGGWTGRMRTAWRSAVERYGYRKIVVTVLAFFAAVLAAVTLIELAAGKPLSNVVRNEDGKGTSLFGNTPAAVETDSTDPTSGTVPEDGAGEKTENDGVVTDPATPAPVEDQPAVTDEEIAGETPTTQPEQGSGVGESTPPAEEAPAPEAPSPGDQAPADGVPTPPTTEVQPKTVPEPAPAE